jgi:hypothetical protein
MSSIIAPTILNHANAEFSNYDDTFYNSYQAQVADPFTRNTYPLDTPQGITNTTFNLTTSSQNEEIFYQGETLPATGIWIRVTATINSVDVSSLILLVRTGGTGTNEFELKLKDGQKLVEDGAVSAFVLTIDVMSSSASIASLVVESVVKDPTVEFILEALADDSLIATLTSDPKYGELVQAAVTGMDATASIDLYAADFNNLFFFRTDDEDVADDDEDILYRTNPSRWNAGNSISFSNATVSLANLVGGDATALTHNTIQYDFVRHMASSITGGYASTDIFSNETALRNAVVATNEGINTSIQTGLTTGGTESTPLTSTDHSKNNVSRTILLKLLSGNVFTQSRVHTVMHNRTNADTWMTVPFMAGDSFVIKVNYKPNNATPLGENIISDRSYKIQLRLT